MSVIILSGRSGSGKSVALRALEDQGYYCVDNMPVSLLPELIAKTLPDNPDLAIGIDARNATHELARFDQIYRQLSALYGKPVVVFTDADDSSLLKRFSETRRRHPLTQGALTLNEAIARERELLSPIALLADLMIDTTLLSSQKLRELITSRLIGHEAMRLELMFESFGYKGGVPVDADFVFDARCLPNPFWDPALRPYSGQDAIIADYFAEQSSVQEFIQDVENFLSNWIKRFELDNRSYLTVAIGCTGGQHRSVFVAERLAAFFRQTRPHTQIRHRDLAGPA